MTNYALEYASLLEKVLNERNKYTGFKYEIEVEQGRKFDRLVISHHYEDPNRRGRGRSVHAFVERATGLLIKDAGWKAPAKRADGSWQSKFDLSVPSEMAEALAVADPYGGYLYLRR
jgi:hypothetical protein